MRGPPPLLSIAGSDPTAGAGIEADLLTFAALGRHGVAVATALTEQDSTRVVRVNPVTPNLFARRLKTLGDDVAIRQVKTGLLPSAQHIARVVAFVAHSRPEHLIVDPIVAATAGARFLDRAALRALRDDLLPFATLVTPNANEAAVLLGVSARVVGRDPERAARRLLDTGVRAVLLKGGHSPGPRATDRLVTAAGSVEFTAARRLGRRQDVHGTGCALSAALLVFLAEGHDLATACERAKKFVTAAIDRAQRIGSGRLRLGLVATKESIAATAS
jgi:hydroxymethylpyrimidine/phosphomethylpyrimidine kinase